MLPILSRAAVLRVCSNGPRASWSSSPLYSTCCDSWSAQQFTDGGQTTQSMQSFITWWLGLTYQNPIMVSNTGVSGQRMDQWYARLAAVLADASKYVIWTTPQNDIGAAFSGFTAAAGPYAGQTINLTNIAAYCIATMQDFIQRTIAAGKTPIVLSAPGAENFVASQVTARNIYNAWLQPYCNAVNAVWIDARTILTDGSLVTVAYKAGLQATGALAGHTSNSGAYYLGKGMAAHPFNSVLNPRNLLPISAASGQTFGTNMLLNCQFATVTGGSGSTNFSGDDPANWVWGGGTAASVVASHIANAFGNDIIRTETYVGAVAQEVRHNQTILTGLGSASGKRVRGCMQFDIAANPVNFQGIDLRSTWTVGGVTTTLIDMYSQVANAGPAPTEAYTITSLTPDAATDLITGTPVQGVSISARARSTGLGNGSVVINQRRAALYLV